MNHEDLLRQKYLRRFKMGILLLTLLAIPAILHSHAAIQSLFNRPSDWIPSTVLEKAEFDDFVKNFAAADLIMIAWQGSDLDSESLAVAATALSPLVEPGQGNTTGQQSITVDHADADALSAGKVSAGKVSAEHASVAHGIDPVIPAHVVDMILELRKQTGVKYPLAWLRTGTETGATGGRVSLSRAGSRREGDSRSEGDRKCARLQEF